MTRTLRPHQEKAVVDAVAELRIADRAHLVSACGTGKTSTGAQVSLEVAPDEAVLVVVPSLDLLAQTVREYQAHLGALTGECYAVCSEQMTPATAEQMERQLSSVCAGISTNAATITRWVKLPGRKTVFSTFHSLGAFVAAHQVHAAPAWGLIVVDEAHRCVGRTDQAWVVVHRNDLIPAKHRFYMTGTARIMEDRDGDGTIVSMDDPAVFGREVHRLGFGKAIELELLVDYRVVVAAVTSREVQALIARSGSVFTIDGVSAPVEMIAAGIAFLKAARQFDLHRAITYHHRVAGAARFAQLLPEITKLLPEDERPPDVHGYTVHGKMAPADRREIIDKLSHSGNSTVAVANVRVLVEGVDLPELDAVMFTDPRESPIDIAQSVGRALRRGDRAQKVATIIVPLMVASTDVESLDALDTSDFETIVRTVQAMGVHDERFAAWLDRRRAGLAAKDPAALPDRRAHTNPPWLQVEGAALTAGFIDQIIVRVVDRASSSWWATYGVAAEFYSQHGHLEPNIKTDRRLYEFVSKNRVRYRRGRLEPQRAEALAAIGIVWDPAEQRWIDLISEVERYREQHGDGHIPTNHVTDDGFWLGMALSRARNDPEKVPALVKKRLDALGMVWSLQDARWLDLLKHLREFKQEHGHVCVDVDYVAPDGFPLGRRTYYLREKEDEIPDWVHSQADALGMVWPKPKDQAWRQFIAGCEAYLAMRREQGVDNPVLDVLHRYVAPDGYPLGSKVGYYRQWEAGKLKTPNRGTVRVLDPEHKQILDKMGMRWQERKPKRRHLTPEEAARLRDLRPEKNATPTPVSHLLELGEAVVEIVDGGVVVPEIAEVLGIADSNLRLLVRITRQRLQGSQGTAGGTAETQTPQPRSPAPTMAVAPPTVSSRDPEVSNTCYYCPEPAAGQIDTGAQLVPVCTDHHNRLTGSATTVDRPPVIVDGSNIAWAGRQGTASYSQLESAVRALEKKFAGHVIHVVIDPALPYQVDPSEQKAVRSAIDQGTCFQVPAGTVGGGDAVILEWANNAAGIVISNDAFRPFQEEYPWLLYGQQRLYGAMRLGGDWIFRERVPPAAHQPPR